MDLMLKATLGAAVTKLMAVTVLVRPHTCPPLWV
ncbi:hypothetical protein ACVWYU_004599 [Pseudomonas sp. TE12234]